MVVWSEIRRRLSKQLTANCIQVPFRVDVKKILIYLHEAIVHVIVRLPKHRGIDLMSCLWRLVQADVQM